MPRSTKKNLPSTWEEICSTNAPYVKYRQQIIATEYWPRSNCSCKGLGFTGVVASATVSAPKLGTNRNRACPCGAKKPDGSAKKFKHCCLKRVEEYKRSKSTLFLCPCVGEAKPLDLPSSVGLSELKNELNLSAFP